MLEITLEQFLEEQASGKQPWLVIDVRTFPEWQDFHLENSENIPLDIIDAEEVLDAVETYMQQLEEKEAREAKTINLCFCCARGARSAKAIQAIEKDLSGCSDFNLKLYNLKGGLSAYPELWS